ncbi:MAG: hypothetical protein AAF664_21805, partial [Planctomycetota bacterium]
ANVSSGEGALAQLGLQLVGVEVRESGQPDLLPDVSVISSLTGQNVLDAFAIPEPSTATCLACSVVLFGIRRRERMS